MIKSKKAMMDDLFDFLFLVVVMMFIMFYFQVSIFGAVDKKNQHRLVLVETTGNEDDYLIQNRMLIELGKEINVPEFNSELNYLYKSGGVSSPPPESLGRYGE